jgi:hypothetical protein
MTEEIINSSLPITQTEPTGSTGNRPGWTVPRPETLPAPTYWPVVLALGTTMILWGLVSSWMLSGVGLLLFALALSGWIGDIRYEE